MILMKQREEDNKKKFLIMKIAEENKQKFKKAKSNEKNQNFNLIHTDLITKDKRASHYIKNPH